MLVGSNGFSILISNSKSPKSKRLYPNNEIQILVKSSNNQVKGTTHTVNVTRSCLPGLKTQCAFTYPRGFHITARIILLESFKSPRNTSRLLPNSSKMKIQSRGSSTPPPLDVHISEAACPFNDALPQLVSPSPSLLTSLLPT